jgi:hypothetical protein
LGEYQDHQQDYPPADFVAVRFPFSNSLLSAAMHVVRLLNLERATSSNAIDGIGAGISNPLLKNGSNSFECVLALLF